MGTAALFLGNIQSQFLDRSNRADMGTKRPAGNECKDEDKEDTKNSRCEGLCAKSKVYQSGEFHGHQWSKKNKSGNCAQDEYAA
jgi:hypothetical protein